VARNGRGQPTNLGTSRGSPSASQLDVGIPSDDFSDTAINGSVWNPYNRCGDLANSEQQAMIPANVRQTGGILIIDQKFEDIVIGDELSAPTTYHYSSGHVAQWTKPFLYGTIIVRAKMPSAAGTWPVIWMLDYQEQGRQPLSADDPGSPGWNPYAEIDFVEFLTGHRTLVNCQIHYNPGSGQVNPGGEVAIPGGFDASTRFMVYKLDWQLNSAVWSIDPEDGLGFRVVQTVTGAGNVPNVPMYLIFSVAIGGAGGTPNSAQYPDSMQIDWVNSGITTGQPLVTVPNAAVQRSRNWPQVGRGKPRNVITARASLADTSSESGSLAVTLANVTSATSGTVTHQGTTAVTLANVTCATSGYVTHQGTDTVTLAGVTSAAAGKVTHQGSTAHTSPPSSSIALANVTCSAAGTTSVGAYVNRQLDLLGALNRLASTSGLELDGAANAWAGTTGKAGVAALNSKAATTGLEFQGAIKDAVNDAAGDGTEDAQGGLNTI